MSEHTHADDVVSGSPYVVVSVNDQPPATLEDFLRAAVVAVTVASERQVVSIHGEARQDGDSIVLYEKEHDGTGKDVRTWRVRVTDGRFEATERSIY